MTGPRSFAAKCAAIMHEREPGALTEAEVRDGRGELVSVIGGNLKALMPPAWSRPRGIADAAFLDGKDYYLLFDTL